MYIILYVHVKISQKIYFIKVCDLHIIIITFVYDLMHNVETVK